MLQKLRFYFYRLFIVDCVGCGSLVVHPRGLCLQCEYEVIDNYSVSPSDVSVTGSGLCFRFLFRWMPGKSKTLSRYVHLLKSPLAEPIWWELARYFSHCISDHREIVFVPIPSRKNRRHSLFFAQALAQIFAGKVVPALNISADDTLEQKRKNKEQRRLIRFTLNEEFTEPLRLARTIVLVDDVITTGSSYEGAYNVLKMYGVCPKNIELWTAFYRENLSAELE